MNFERENLAKAEVQDRRPHPRSRYFSSGDGRL